MTSILDDQERQATGRRISDQPSIGRPLGIAVVVVGLVGSIFTAGYNWRSVAIIEESTARDRENYVRKDVQAEQLRTLEQQLGAIKASLEDLKTEVRTQRR